MPDHFGIAISLSGPVVRDHSIKLFHERLESLLTHKLSALRSETQMVYPSARTAPTCEVSAFPRLPR
jgi:hypothetical protein